MTSDRQLRQTHRLYVTTESEPLGRTRRSFLNVIEVYLSRDRTHYPRNRLQNSERNQKLGDGIFYIGERLSQRSRFSGRIHISNVHSIRFKMKGNIVVRPDILCVRRTNIPSCPRFRWSDDGRDKRRTVGPGGGGRRIRILRGPVFIHGRDTRVYRVHYPETTRGHWKE